MSFESPKHVPEDYDYESMSSVPIPEIDHEGFAIYKDRIWAEIVVKSEAEVDINS